MNFQLYRLEVSSAHFGQGDLTRTSPVFTADRLFSALFMEALKMGCDQNFLEACQKDEIVFSDGMLYQSGVFLPKPIGLPRPKRQERGDVQVARLNRKRMKQSKTIEFIHEDDFESYIIGDYEYLEDLVSAQESLYQTESQTKNSVSRVKSEDTELYRLNYTRYAPGTELVVIGTENDLLEELFKSLQTTGLGGKRSQGLGRFNLTIEPITGWLADKITLETHHPVILLTTALPIDEDMEASMEDSTYLIVKASGFAYSTTSPQAYRKQDLYKFKVGSVFSQSFRGQIVNVAPDDFPHPVWNYAKPLFIALDPQEVMV